MTDTTDLSMEGIERLPLKIFTENAYLEYSMYVILDRALPSIGDGLKPVQRRIIYAMSELGLRPTAKYKKSARTVGDVLGKFHPHGDSACYEAMVLMAQPFTYRYPIVDGQGNWGAPDDPKSFAAMRYTESKLSPYSQTLLAELGQGTVDYQPNFDGTMDEPTVLPAQLPNLLLNGTTGIAVGMATDIPPHNLTEVVEACIYLVDNPKATTQDLCMYIKGPDFPTDAEIITPNAHIREMYETGHGSIKMRAVYTQENGDIVITALPHQASGSKIMEQIAGQIQAKKLSMIDDLRDESDHEAPTRIVIVPRSNRVDKKALMDHLFATTDLEKNYRVNMNVIGLNGRPQVKGLKTLLSEWLEFRKSTVIRRLSHQLQKILDRLHKLEGYMIAFLNIDEVIHIIRTEDKPKPVLMERFNVTDVQAEYILELKLRHLAKLEEMKILKEQDELAKERDRLEKILNSDTRLKTLIKKELKSLINDHGDPRRSSIVEREEAKALSQTDLVPSEPVTVIISKKGWIRAAKGHEIDKTKLKYKSGDRFLGSATGKSNQSVLLLDSNGRSYTIPAHTLPSARSHGEPVTGKLTLEPGASVSSILMGNDSDQYLLASDAGYGFVTSLSDLYTKNKAGKVVLSLPKGALPIPPIPIKNIDDYFITAISNEGRMLMFPLKDLPVLVKGKGNKIINIPSKKAAAREELVKHLFVMKPESQLILFAGKRHLTLKPGHLADYVSSRGLRGKKLPRGYQNVDRYTIKENEQMALSTPSSE